MTMASSLPMLLSPSNLKRLKRVLRQAVPADWATAVEVAVEMAEAEAPSLHERRVARFWSFTQFTCGAVPSFFLTVDASEKQMAAVGSLMAGMLAFSALIVGFVVTLMVFTGSAGNVSTLDVDQTRRHIARIKYLLASQASTLAAALAVAAAVMLWYGCSVAAVDAIWSACAVALVGGCFAISMLRAALLPFQIFELHSASLHDALAAKIKTSNARYSDSGE